jgi:hypothetical protein
MTAASLGGTVMTANVISPPRPAQRHHQPPSIGQTMSTSPNHGAAQTFMVVVTIRDDTNLAESAPLRQHLTRPRT